MSENGIETDTKLEGEQLGPSSVTLNRDVTPDRDRTPDYDGTPDRDRTPDCDEAPDRNETLGHDGTSDRDDETPDRDETLGHDETLDDFEFFRTLNSLQCMPKLKCLKHWNRRSEYLTDKYLCEHISTICM